MAMVRSRGRAFVPFVARGGSRRKLRPVEWRSFSGSFLLDGDLDKDLLVLCSTAVLEDFTQGTIMRIRGHMYLRFGTGAGVHNIFMGITLVDANQVTVPASWPSPSGNGSSNQWLWWGFRQVVANASPQWGLTDIEFEVDTRSMRRLEGAAQALVLIAEQSSGAAPNETILDFGGRVLVKE